MYAAKLVSTVLAIVHAVGVQAVPSPLPGYGIEDFTWEVETFPGGPKKSITGTVQDVVAELDITNPNWKDDFNLTQSNIEARDLSFPFTGIICDARLGEWQRAQWYYIDDGIYYLNGVPGTPTLGPGPGNCGRVSCSYNSAIYWCNDATSTFSLPGFSTIAAGARTILSNCGNSLTGEVLGQVFAQFFQNWNTIVRYDPC